MRQPSRHWVRQILLLLAACVVCGTVTMAAKDKDSREDKSRDDKSGHNSSDSVSRNDHRERDNTSSDRDNDRHENDNNSHDHDSDNHDHDNDNRDHDDHDHDEVEMCHLEEHHGAKTIPVSWKDVGKHQREGDHLGKCPESPSR